MYNHESQDYHCPFCQLVSGIADEKIRSREADVFYKDSDIIGFISSDGWPNNKGHVIISTNKHFENIYDTPDELLAKVNVFAKKVAFAFKEIYQSEGVMIRQSNEPADGQDVWHYHVHVFPMCKNN